MVKPTNLAEYLALIDSAVHEMEQLINYSQGEFDNDMDRLLQRYQILISELKAFREAIDSQTIIPGDYREEGLAGLAEKTPASDPVHVLITEIDRVAREGYGN
ncbi:MAG: hypothetical protein JJ992_26765 [Planctomycetes bacterium]|nr:hypothetical protein [Planctomycetota bacterium]